MREAGPASERQDEHRKQGGPIAVRRGPRRKYPERQNLSTVANSTLSRNPVIEILYWRREWLRGFFWLRFLFR